MLGGNETEAGYRPSLVQGKAHRFVVLSGCSGAGKSSLLSELGRRGFPIYEEPSRQVVKEQLYIGGDALPWGNVSQFLELTISRSIHHMVTAARRDRLSFFDRGIIDQVSGLAHQGLPIPEHLAAAVRRFRYHEKVFIMPPWREIFSNDDERRHSFEDALASYEAQLSTYERFGYQIIFVPKLDVSARADFRADPAAGRPVAPPSVIGLTERRLRSGWARRFVTIMMTIKLTYSHSMLSADGASEVRMLRTKDAPVVDGQSSKPPRWVACPRPH